MKAYLFMYLCIYDYNTLTNSCSTAFIQKPASKGNNWWILLQQSFTAQQALVDTELAHWD